MSRLNTSKCPVASDSHFDKTTYCETGARKSLQIQQTPHNKSSQNNFVQYCNEMNMNNTSCHPLNIPGAMLWHQNRQQQFEKPPELIPSRPVSQADVCITFPTLPLHFLAANLFSQSLATTLGEDFEPTPLRENLHHAAQNKPSLDTTADNKNLDVLLSSKGKYPSNVSVPSSAASYLSDVSNEEGHDSDTEEQSLDQFSPYQQKHWEQQYRALLKYKRTYGHCRVPHKYKANIALARWVKRQRYQYRLRQEGDQTSTMTDYRLKKLEDVGFVWFSHASTWEQRLEELKTFQEENGHCNVPSSYPTNPKLAVWVKCQRRQYKLFRRGKSSHMTQPRIEALEEINFKWEIRQGAMGKLN